MNSEWFVFLPDQMFHEFMTFEFRYKSLTVEPFTEYNFWIDDSKYIVICHESLINEY